MTAESARLRRIVVAACLLSAIVGLASYRVVDRVSKVQTDYNFHMRAGLELADQHRLTTPHPLYPGLVAAALKVGTADVRRAGLSVAVLLYVIATLVIFWMFVRSRPANAAGRGWAGGPRELSPTLAATLTLALMLVAPMTFLDWGSGRLYYGYLAVHVYHNPTMVALKPFALLWMISVVPLFGGDRVSGGRLRYAAPVFAVLATLAKPSFAICFLPALLLFAAVQTRSGRRAEWVPLVLGSVAPASALLVWQYMFTFEGDQMARGAIQFAPLLVLRGHVGGPLDEALWSLVYRGLLSLVYPAAVSLFFWRDVRQRVDMGLSLLAMMFSLGFVYLLAESGKRTFHGNFLWSGQICLFVLFVMSTLVLVDRALRPKAQGDWRRIAACGVALLLHVISGVYFYLHPLSW